MEVCIGAGITKGSCVMIFSKSKDMVISYTDSQTDGEALLFIHGNMMNKEVWEKQVAFFSQSYRTITFDLYGFGKSKGEFRNSSFEDHADDIKDLLDYLLIKKTNLVGWSIGACIALVFAERHSDRLSKLILVDGTPKLLASDDFACAVPPEAQQQFVEALRIAKKIKAKNAIIQLEILLKSLRINDQTLLKEFKKNESK